MSAELKLLLFAPCEKVIIGNEGDNTASLISILQGFEIAKDESGTAPISWHGFSLWENDFSNHAYRTRFELLAPTGDLIFHIELPLALEHGKRFLRQVVKAQGFPVKGWGVHTVKLFLKTDDGDFVERASFPIPITKSDAPLAPPTQS